VFFNKEYNKLKYISLNNNNNYTLGKVGKYNIIIAILPNREYNIFFIVGIIKNILYSFLNIKIGLIISISGSILS